jgi:hypothetical protein
VVSKLQAQRVTEFGVFAIISRAQRAWLQIKGESARCVGLIEFNRLCLYGDLIKTARHTAVREASASKNLLYSPNTGS